MNRGPNIFDFLVQNQIPYYVSNPASSEEENRDQLISSIEKESIDFAFIYWAGLDGLLHQVGNQSPEVPARLRVYEKWIQSVLSAANTHYKDVRLYMFSDHGMANCDELLDLKKEIDQLPIAMEKDYAVVYDSTMARFWFFNDRARQLVTQALNTIPQGRIMLDDELKQLHSWFDDYYFGQLIFLVKEGVLIVPSHMGERPIRAMHGYHPSDKHSYACLFTNQKELPAETTAIPHIYRLMEHNAKLAKQSNV
jgi:hypothetical protein